MKKYDDLVPVKMVKNWSAVFLLYVDMILSFCQSVGNTLANIIEVKKFEQNISTKNVSVPL
jgi:hypothetical protein